MTDFFSGDTGSVGDSNDSDDSDDFDEPEDGGNGVSETVGSWFFVSFLLLFGRVAQFLQI